MSCASILQVIAGASFLMLLVVLFLLYQDPLFEIYLSGWRLC